MATHQQVDVGDFLIVKEQAVGVGPTDPFAFQRVGCNKVARLAQALSWNQRSAVHIEARAQTTFHGLLEAALERMRDW